MKRMSIILLVAAASMAAFGQPPQGPPPPAALVVPKKEAAQIPIPVPIQIHTPLTVPPAAPTLKNQKVNRVDGMSSKPWAQIVGWQPGYSAFPRPELRDPSMPVFWIGHEPWH